MVLLRNLHLLERAEAGQGRAMNRLSSRPKYKRIRMTRANERQPGREVKEEERQ